MSKKSLVAILAASVALCAVLVATQIKRRATVVDQPSPVSTSTATTATFTLADTTDWVDFNDDALGIALRHPKDWKASAEQFARRTIIVFKHPTGKAQLRIDKQTGLTEFFSNFFGEAGDSYAESVLAKLTPKARTDLYVFLEGYDVLMKKESPYSAEVYDAGRVDEMLTFNGHRWYILPAWSVTDQNEIYASSVQVEGALWFLTMRSNSWPDEGVQRFV